MKYVRIHNDEDGASHFEEVDLAMTRAEYAPPAPPIDLSELFATTSAVIFSVPGGWFGDWHPSPRRQLYFALSGQLEVEVSDGEVRIFNPGDIVLGEDVDGKGHTSRGLGSEPTSGVFVHLADGASSVR